MCCKTLSQPQASVVQRAFDGSGLHCHGSADLAQPLWTCSQSIISGEHNLSKQRETGNAPRKSKPKLDTGCMALLILMAKNSQGQALTHRTTKLHGEALLKLQSTAA